MATDIQKPTGRRLRVRVDIYRKAPRRLYQPVRGQAVTLNVNGRAEHRAMFRGILAYLKSEAWKKDVKTEEEGDDD